MNFATVLLIASFVVCTFAQDKILKIRRAAMTASFDTGTVRSCYLDCIIVEDRLPFEIQLMPEDFESMDHAAFMPVSHLTSSRHKIFLLAAPSNKEFLFAITCSYSRAGLY